MKRIFLLALILSVPAFAVRFQNTAGLDLGNFNHVLCSTGVTCSVDKGRLKMIASSPSFTLESGEVLANSTDDVVSVTSDDESTDIRSVGFEAKDAIFSLWADQGDDAADKWSLTSTTTGTLIVKQNTTSLLTGTANGDWTFAGVTPYITIGDAGAEDTGVVFDGATLDFNITLDDSASLLVIGKGTAAGTTDAIRIDTNQDVTFVQAVVGLGTDPLSGFLQKQVTATATTITAAQCGSTFINGGAIEIELPEASTVLGCQLTFVTGNASNFDVDPDGGDQILVATNAAGDAMRNATLGNSITIQATSASTWTEIAIVGTWSDIN